MSKITSKFQVTLPRRLAREYGLEPGDDIEFVAAGDIIHVLPPTHSDAQGLSVEERLRAFDAATERQRRRERSMGLTDTPPEERDWTRDSLYDREKTR
ncbi:MAG: AbrB/MazE/SpoVT family DNA-binding domain-containing protein [Xanthomonadales bacterium]|jgi:AbrB family looped-hinge helix DNA binding protein|nr:AbrB/MazE/SpoVT family DNA-binding domain-containing protein [Xanthomonadales bacterium]